MDTEPLQRMRKSTLHCFHFRGLKNSDVICLESVVDYLRTTAEMSTLLTALSGTQHGVWSESLSCTWWEDNN